MRPLTFFDHWVETAYSTTPTSLGLYRIAFALIILLKALPQGLWISSFPDSFFFPPPGPTFFLFHGFPSATFFYALNGLLVFLTVCLLFGYHTRSVSVLFTIGFTFLQAWEYSFGKINHEFVFILVPILFAWAGWGNAWSVDGARTQVTDSRAPAPGAVALFAFILSIMMLSASVPKMLSGWLNPRAHAVLGQVILYQSFVTGRQNPISKAALHIHSAWFWEPFDWFSCGIELAFICVFFWRPMFRLVCALATLFYFGIVLLLRIYSWATLLSYGAFADWDEMAEYFPYNLLRKLATRISRASPIFVLIIAALTTSIYLVFGNPVMRLLGRTPQEADYRIGLCIVVLATATGLAYLIRRLRLIRFSERRSTLAIVNR